MLVWDPVSGRNLPFGTLKTAALGTFPFQLCFIMLILPLDKSKKEYNPRPCCESGAQLVERTQSTDSLMSTAVKIFDLLYLNGTSLLHKSLKFRKRNLRACVSEIKGRIEFATEWEGKTAQDIRKRMDEVMELRGEGLVIKHPDSEYVLNGRNRDWVKVKPEYMVRALAFDPICAIETGCRTTWVKLWTFWLLVCPFPVAMLY